MTSHKNSSLFTKTPFLSLERPTTIQIPSKTHSAIVAKKSTRAPKTQNIASFVRKHIAPNAFIKLVFFLWAGILKEVTSAKFAIENSTLDWCSLSLESKLFKTSLQLPVTLTVSQKIHQVSQLKLKSQIGKFIKFKPTIKNSERFTALTTKKCNYS